jgi:antitoxin CcdA
VVIVTALQFTSAKRAVNLSLNREALELAKALNMNVSQLCDQHLCEVVRQEQAKRWREEYADFITAYNVSIEEDGLPLERWKSF